MDIGSKIREYRNNQGLTQIELASKANISRSYLADVEKNRYNASVETLKKIATALGMPISQLLTVEEKLEITTSSINKIQEMARDGLNYKLNEFYNNPSFINDSPSLYVKNATFQQFENEEFTTEEQKEISNFIKYILSKRNK